MATVPPTRPHHGMRFTEFVALIACLMAMNALGIDIILPALPEIGRSLHIADENQRQFLIAAYVLGFGAAQLIYGPLSDRYGRKPVLVGSVCLFVALSLFVSFAVDLTTIVVARFLQGVAAASSRVLTVSIVRDCYSGRTMARVMSLSFMTFLAVPILAPTIGQLILYVAPWQVIFYVLAGFGAVLVTWGGLRLPETLHAEYRRPISVKAIAGAARAVIGNRYSAGYTIASACMFGSLMGFINSVEQIFADIFHRPEIFTFVFGGCAATMGVSAYLNSRIVERFGSRRVSQVGLLGFVAVAALHVAWAAGGRESWQSFALFQCGSMFCFSLCSSNFGAMAMEPVGHIAGTAASIQGFVSTIGGALLGLAIGQSFNGTTMPVAAGYLVLGLCTLAVVFVVEGGRLFQPHHPAVVEAG